MLMENKKYFENGVIPRPNCFLNKITFSDNEYRQNPLLSITVDYKNNELVIFKDNVNATANYPTFLTSKIGLVSTTDTENPLVIDYVYVSVTEALIQLVEGELVVELDGSPVLVQFKDGQISYYEPSTEEPLQWLSVTELYNSVETVVNYFDNEGYIPMAEDEESYMLFQENPVIIGLTKHDILTSCVHSLTITTKMVAIMNEHNQLDVDAKPNLEHTIETSIDDFDSLLATAFLIERGVNYFAEDNNGDISTYHPDNADLAEEEEDTEDDFEDDFYDNEEDEE